MKIKLKQDELRKLLKDLKQNKFTADGGCACGEYAYQLDENLWLAIYRGCKKSCYTPNNKWWKVNDIEFYKHVDVHTHNHTGYPYRTIEWNEEDLIHNVKLDWQQEMLIIQRAKRITMASGYGREYK